MAQLVQSNRSAQRAGWSFSSWCSLLVALLLAAAPRPSWAGSCASIDNLSPATGSVGTTISIIGSFQQLVNYEVTFNGVLATNVTLVGAGEIRAVVPAGATTGLVEVADLDLTCTSNGVVFTVTPANSAPTALALSRANVPENLPADAYVGDFSTTDPNAGNTFTYTLVSGTGAIDNASFLLTSGGLYLRPTADFETKSSYTVRVRTTDQGGLFFEQAFTISITNVNESPTALTLSNSSLAENTGANAVVGTFSTTDPDAGNTFNYFLQSGAGSTDNAAFTLSGNTLRLRASANFEVKNSYAIRVRTTDQGGLQFEQTFTINITNVNETPSAPTISNNRIDENVPVGTVIGVLSATDPEGGPLTYLLEPTGGAVAYIRVVGNEVRTIVPIDYEERAAISSLVYADDAQGNRGFAFITIFFNDLLEDYTINAVEVLPQGIWNNVTVTGTGVANLGFNQSTIQGTFRVQPGGRVNLRQRSSLIGSGAFVLEAGATVFVSAETSLEAAGVSDGAVQTAVRQYSDDAIYIFQAENNARRGGSSYVVPMGTGVPATVRELEVTSNDPATTGRRSLSQPVAVRRRLVLSGGELDTDGYALTLLSDATRTAYAMHNGGTTLGNVTVQRFVGNPAAASYRHLSSPVQGATVADLTTAGFTPKVNPAYNALPQPSLSAANFPNIFGFDETRGGTTPAYAGFTTGYFSPAALSQTLTPGRGYSTYLPGNRTPDLVGALTTGDLSMPLSVTGTVTANNKAGWHLLGNPYPQAIDWDLATIPTGMNAAVYVWYSTGGNNGAYRARVNNTGNLTNGVIALGQALWVRATAATTFTFTNALRVENGTIGLGRAAQSSVAALSLTLTDATGAQDEVTVAAHSGATANFDGAFDAARPGANVGVPTLSALINGEPALVSTLAEAVAQGQSATVELTATLPAVGRYTLGVGHLTGWDAATVELLDRTTGTRYALTPQTTLALTATRTNEAVTGRFALLFNQSRVLGTAAASVAAPLTVSPNPVSVGGSVRVTGCPVSLPLTLLDLTGRNVGTALADSQGTATVAVRTLAAGTYLVRTADGRTTRLVVE